MNHIIKLPRSRKKDYILMIKDQCNRMIHLKAVKKTQTTKEV